VKRATAPRSPRVKTLAEQIEAAIDRLYELRSVAANERRRHSDTEKLLDGLDDTGRALRHLARGDQRPAA
jgi:hypothetical protein